jgi:hypothetical protein
MRSGWQRISGLRSQTQPLLTTQRDLTLLRRECRGDLEADDALAPLMGDTVEMSATAVKRRTVS